MAITISGENNNDKILASDGVIDEISGINIVGLLTAGHINVGSNIQLGNAGIITATTFVGNVTGNVNSTSPLLLQTGGSERFRITSDNALGIAGANYGSSGQVLTSGGSGSAVSWATPAVTGFTNGSNNRVVTATSGSGLNGESNLTFDGTTLTATGQFNLAGHIFLQPGGTSWSSTSNRPLLGRQAGGELRLGAGSDSSSNITFYTSPSAGGTLVERLRITSTGLVGIGEASPSSDVTFTVRNDVVAASGNATMQINNLYQGTANQSNASGAEIEFKFKNHNAAHNWWGGRILCSNTDNYNQYSHLQFHTASQGNAVERMRLDHDGDLTLYGKDNAELKLKAGTTTGNGVIAFLNSSGTTKGNIFYDTDDNFMVFKTNGTASSNERLRIHSDGKVTINSTATQPSSTVTGFQLDADLSTLRLMSGAGASGTTTASISLGGSNHNSNIENGANSGAQMNLYNYNTSDGNSSAVSFMNSNGLSASRILGLNVSHSSRTGALVFMVSNGSHPTEKLRITSDGKIGIGEDDPDGNYLLIRAASTVGTKNGHIMLTGDSSTVGQGPQIVFSESGSGSNWAGAYIGHAREGGGSQGSLIFATRGSTGDANTVPTERLRIMSDGEIKINHTQSSTPLNNTFLSIYDANSDSSAIDASGISKNYAMINLHNYGTGNVTDTTGIGFGAGSGFSYTKGSIAFTRSGSYGTGDLVFLTNNDQNTTMVNDTDEKLRITKEGLIQTGLKEITGGNNLAIQNFVVKGKWSGSPSIGKEIELLSGYDSSVKMVAIGYNLTDISGGGTYGGDLVFHTQPLYSSPTTPIPERMRILSSGEIKMTRGGISAQPSLDIYGSGNASDVLADNLRIHNWGDSDGDYWRLGVNCGLNGSGNSAKPSNTLKGAAVTIDGRYGRVFLQTSPSSSSTVNDAVIVDSAGVVSTPLQPAFRTYTTADKTNNGNFGGNSASPNNSTWADPNGTLYKWDNNDDFDHTTGKFTAPVDGKYHFSMVWDANGVKSMIDMKINGSYVLRYEPTGNSNDSWETHTWSCTVAMGAGDYAILEGRGASGSYPFHMGNGYWGFWTGHKIT